MTRPYKDKAPEHDRYAFFKSLLSRRSLLSPPGLIAISFSAICIVAYSSLSHISRRDPTSFFFDSRHAYDKIYSTERVRQAEDFISATKVALSPTRSSLDVPLLCVGIATVARRGDQYVGLTVGSLLDGLSAEERNSIFLNILVAHTDPARHPVYGENWIKALSDRLLEYSRGTATFDQIQHWEETGQYRNKTIYDYTYLLKDCYETGAEYVAMIEDDTIALRGWYQRAIDAVDGVETTMRARSRQSKWVYLRLFYAADLLGWNSENWRTYLFWSALFWLTSTSLILVLRRRLRNHLDGFSDWTMAFVSGVCVPGIIIFYFLAGRQTVSPLSPGIHEMNKYGCCSQGLIFPRSIIPELLARTDLVSDWLVDMMIEQIADKQGWSRWAVVPSLLQHIGVTSSKGYGFDDSAGHLWNFRFENHPLQA